MLNKNREIMKKDYLKLLVLIIVFISSGLLSCQDQSYSPFLGQHDISDRYPIWTPDGQNIFFSHIVESTNLYSGQYFRSYGQGTGIWKIGTDGTSSLFVFENDNIDINNLNYDIHPDGRNMLFSFNKSLYTVSVYQDSIDHLSLKALVTTNGVYINYPKWSPDVEWIAYEFQEFFGDTTGIWIMDKDGAESRKLFNGITPTWHPDGESILAAAYKDSSEFTYLVRHYPFSETPSDTLDIFQDKLVIFPDYSQDGSKLAFQVVSEESSDIWISDIDGTNLIRLNSGGQPAWSPDGETIAYVSIEEDGPRIFLMNSEGKDIRQLIFWDSAFPNK